MKDSINIKEMKAQVDFCMMLMNHLQNDIHTAEISYDYVKNHTRMEIDIIRIRRELLTLRDMIN